MKNNKEFWDKEAPHWVEPIPLFGPLTMPIFVQIWATLGPIEETLLKTATVVNLGAGVNNKSYLPNTSSDNIIAIDISDKMLAKNNAKHKVIADLSEGIPIADQLSDLVVSFFLMRYLDVEAQLRLLIEMKRVMKQDGKAVVVDLHRSAFGAQEKSEFELSNYLQLASQAGLTTLDSTSTVHQHTQVARHGWYTQREKIEANIGIAVLGK